MEVQELIDRVHARRLEAINSFAVFQFNYDRNFIEVAFRSRPHLIEHFERKFLDYWHKHGSKAAVIVFYMELDTENKKLLAEYVINRDYH